MKRSGEKADGRNAERRGFAALAALAAGCALWALASAARAPAETLSPGCVKSGGGYVLAKDSRLDRGCPERLKHLAGGRMDVNRMSAADFDLLPGIGPEKSSRLTEERQNRGGFDSVEEAAAVAGGKAGKSLLTFTQVER